MHGNGVLDWVLSDDAHEMISWFMIDVPLYDMTIIVAYYAYYAMHSLYPAMELDESNPIPNSLPHHTTPRGNFMYKLGTKLSCSRRDRC